MNAQGKAFKYGDNVDTDVIIPARYLAIQDAEELSAHCMEDIDKDFVNKISKGDMIIAGKNFGCGSSREHAPLVIKTCGVSCVIAEASQNIETGDEISVDFDSGMIYNRTKNQEYKGQPFPEFMQNIIKNEGLVNYINSLA